MAKLKRDERLCPLCAETIKAAAIRCRYCHAELTPVETAPEPPEAVEESTKSRTETPELEPTPEPTPEPVEGSTSATTVLASRRLTAILAATAILSAAVIGALWWRAETDATDFAPDGTLVGDQARSEAVVAAADLSQRALSYDYRTLANDMEVARPGMTASFRKKYDATMRQARPNTLKNKIVLKADVVASSIIVATEHQARLLVFVNQATTAETTEASQTNSNSLVITLVRGAGEWKLSELTALG